METTVCLYIRSDRVKSHALKLQYFEGGKLEHFKKEVIITAAICCLLEFVGGLEIQQQTECMNLVLAIFQFFKKVSLNFDFHASLLTELFKTLEN